MRIRFDKKKSEQLKNDPRRKIGFEEAKELIYEENTKKKTPTIDEISEMAASGKDGGNDG